MAFVPIVMIFQSSFVAKTNITSILITSKYFITVGSLRVFLYQINFLSIQHLWLVLLRYLAS